MANRTEKRLAISHYQQIKEKMKNDYTFILQEKDKAAMLCAQWHIGSNAKIVDDWIDIYIQGMKEGTRTVNTDKAMFVEQQLETIYRTSIAHLDKPLLQYLLARLLFYNNNVLQFGDGICRIDSAYVEPLIKELIKRIRFSSTDFLFLMNDYLAPTWVYPQNDLSAKLIGIAQKDNLLNTEYPEKYAVFTSLLEIIAKKGYHHDIKGFKRLLKFILIDDIEIITYLKTYHVATAQGCFEMIHTLFNFPIHSDDYTDFTIKRQIIEVFDMARGAKISPSWKSKALDLISCISIDKLKDWCETINNGNKWIYDNDTGWKDDVVTRFRKTALRMNVMITNGSTSPKVG